MSMRITYLPTYWEAQEALSVITFLDELRDLLWASYGEEIMEKRQQLIEGDLASEQQLDLGFNDEIPF